MKKVFISGISGGIGTALAKKFISQGYYVIGQYNTHKPSVFSEAVQADLSLSEDRKKLCDYLSDFFDVNRSHVLLRKGERGREKTIEITGRTEEELEEVLDTIP